MVVLLLLDKALHILLGVQVFHLLADVEQVVFDVLEHADLRHDQLPEAIALQDHLVPEQRLSLVQLQRDLSEYPSALLVVDIDEGVVLPDRVQVQLLVLLVLLDAFGGLGDQLDLLLLRDAAGVAHDILGDDGLLHFLVDVLEALERPAVVVAVIVRVLVKLLDIFLHLLERGGLVLEVLGAHGLDLRLEGFGEFEGLAAALLVLDLESRADVRGGKFSAGFDILVERLADGL